MRLSPNFIAFFKHFDYLIEVSMNFLPSPNDKLLDELPDIAIQGDYHPGNLLFQDESVSGVLDFD